ncbi:DeoR family transcriptional regulator [Thermocrinis sp.]|uniref:DeoR family transcriptional regulator n=1 Tax=Thermocrinis sp. TaxID=2024383 RepID=UPI002FDE2F19
MSRKDQILNLIANGYNTVKSLAEYFNVSLMTIYRDVRELEREGKIIRKHGELLLKSEEEQFQETGVCAYCGKTLDRRLEFVYRLKSKATFACCAHCGLLLYNDVQDKEIQSCMTRDFISGNPINCFSAWYVVGSSAKPCCIPSVIAFGNKEDAERFARGFGGKVFDFETALHAVEELMKRGHQVVWEKML